MHTVESVRTYANELHLNESLIDIGANLASEQFSKDLDRFAWCVGLVLGYWHSVRAPHSRPRYR
jgi:hypothetical protein